MKKNESWNKEHKKSSQKNRVFRIFFQKSRLKDFGLTQGLMNTAKMLRVSRRHIVTPTFQVMGVVMNYLKKQIHLKKIDYN